MPGIDFAFYQGEYGGRMGEADFDRLAPRAVCALDALTQGRATLAAQADEATRHKARMALCALAEHELGLEESGGRHVLREAVGKQSASYAPPAGGQEARQRALVRKYLGGVRVNGVPLLYRGCMEGRGNEF